jgi:hypothetical protein
LAQADQVGGDGALRAVPGAWVPFERAGDGERTGLSILQEVSSKALLYRCAVSSAGCYGQVTAVADRGVLGSVPADVVATVMVLQALEGLSDRDAAAQLKQNIAWKVACRLPLTDSGSIRRC